MKINIENEETKASNSPEHSHTSHLKMMAICCGIPVIGLLLIAGLGINSPSFETLLFIACPVLMFGMMYNMRKKSGSHEKSCCQSDVVKAKPIADNHIEINKESPCCDKPEMKIESSKIAPSSSSIPSCCETTKIGQPAIEDSAMEGQN